MGLTWSAATDNVGELRGLLRRRESEHDFRRAGYMDSPIRGTHEYCVIALDAARKQESVLEHRHGPSLTP